MPCKSMLQKIKYPYDGLDTLDPMHINDILIKISVFLSLSSILECEKDAQKFGKEAKMILVIDTWLHSLTRAEIDIRIGDNGLIF